MAKAFSTPSKTVETSPPQAQAILVAVQLQGQPDEEIAVSLAELRALLAGVGVESAERLIQKRGDAFSPLVLGEGKLQELRNLTEERVGAGKSPLIVFDRELSPGQQRNLEQYLDVEVFDRTEVILRVFARRARTKTAQLEVELARLNYEAPRARDDSALDAQEGGGGRGGRGHSNLALRKQALRKRIAAVRRELQREGAQQHTRRSRRDGTPTAALVGYTNAGKSSLMRALTGSEAYVQDELFATLGTTVRALEGAGPRILIADTVGFIRNLPNHLLASFRTTLDEALDAELLLHVVDASDPDWPSRLEVTRDVLDEIDASNIASLLVFNKLDRVSDEVARRLETEHPDAVFMSAHDPADVERLRARVVEVLEADFEEGVLEVPFSRGELLGQIHAQARVLSHSYSSEGSVMELRARSHLLSEWRRELASGGG